MTEQDLERRIAALEEERRRLINRIEAQTIDSQYVKDCMRDGLAHVRTCLETIAGQVDASAKLLFELESRVFPQTIHPAPLLPAPTVKPEDDEIP